MRDKIDDVNVPIYARSVHANFEINTAKMVNKRTSFFFIASAIVAIVIAIIAGLRYFGKI